MSKRVNPQRRPATAADIKRAKDIAFREAVDFALAILFTVLMDKEGFNKFQLQRTWKETQQLCDSVAQGYVSINDLLRVLDKEYDIKFVR